MHTSIMLPYGEMSDIYDTKHQRAYVSQYIKGATLNNCSPTVASRAGVMPLSSFDARFRSVAESWRESLVMVLKARHAPRIHAFLHAIVDLAVGMRGCQWLLFRSLYIRDDARPRNVSFGNRKRPAVTRRRLHLPLARFSTHRAGCVTNTAGSLIPAPISWNRDYFANLEGSHSWSKSMKFEKSKLGGNPTLNFKNLSISIIYI